VNIGMDSPIRIEMHCRQNGWQGAGQEIETNMHGFEVGDVVRLKSGGPAITVSGFKDGDVWCNWFVENHDIPKVHWFMPEMLEKVEPRLPRQPEVIAAAAFTWVAPSQYRSSRTEMSPHASMSSKSSRRFHYVDAGNSHLLSCLAESY